jgi:hypothetical protein
MSQVQDIGNVVKCSQVRPGPPRRLGASAGGAGPAASPAASARIIDQAADTALIEVVCSCGNRIHLECQAPQNQQQPGADARGGRPANRKET